MPAICAAPNCNHRTKHGFTLHMFPSNEQRRLIWMVNCGRMNWIPTVNDKLCSAHFTEDQFELHRADGKKLLKWSAIPTVFDHSTPSKKRKYVRKDHMVTESALGAEKVNTRREKAHHLIEKHTAVSTDAIELVKVEYSVAWDRNETSTKLSSESEKKNAEDTECDADGTFSQSSLDDVEIYDGQLWQNVKNQLCRICGTKQEMLLPISPVLETDDAAEPTLSKKIEMYLPVQIRPEDDLPISICEKCRNLVESWHELHVSCLAADCVLRNMSQIQNSGVISKRPTGKIGLEKQTPLSERQQQQSRSSSLSSSITSEVEKQMPLDKEVHNVEVETFCAERDHQYANGRPRMLIPFKPFKCRYCCDTFARKDEREQHQEQCALEAVLCHECGKTVAERCQLKKHLRKHNVVQTPHICDKCGKQLSNKYRLLCHMRRFHSGARQAKHFCEPCCKVFFNLQNLKTHQQRHKKGLVRCLNIKILTSIESENEVQYVCPVCQEKFQSKISLIVHMNAKRKTNCAQCKEVLLNEKQTLSHRCKSWMCRFCGKRFNTKVYLSIHERRHTGERPFVCKTCGARFVSNSALARHHVNHEPASLHCGQCGKDFKHKQTFNEHMQKHAGVEYPCLICDKKFRGRNTLYRHRKWHRM